jgi:hypothetical protein
MKRQNANNHYQNEIDPHNATDSYSNEEHSPDQISTISHTDLELVEDTQLPPASGSQSIEMLSLRLYRALQGYVHGDPSDAVQDHMLWLLERYRIIPRFPFRYHLICARNRNYRVCRNMKREKLVPPGWEPDDQNSQ